MILAELRLPRQDVEKMEKQINGLKNDPANAGMRWELDRLHDTVTDHALRLDTLSELTDKATGITIKALDIVELQTNNPNVQQANVWIKFVREQQDELSKLAGKMTWKSKKTKSISSGAPVSGGGYSAPQEMPETQSKIGKFIPPGILSRQRSVQAGSSNIGPNERQHQAPKPPPKPPRPTITSVPSLSRSSSPYTAPGTPSSSFHNSNIGRASVSTLGTQDDQDPKLPTSKITSSSGHLSRSSSFYAPADMQSSGLHISSMSRTAVSPGQEYTPGSSPHSRRPLTRVYSEPRAKDLGMNRSPSHTPSRQYQNVEPSVRSEHGSEVDQPSYLSVKQRAEEFDRVGILMGRPHQHRGGYNP
ncbi:hypothetical protein N7536_011946 [Penicillium majusculum]|uniref:Uncharacterized protein n=1 Tax=Penicillium solitum TaxID=60172 RepID=A0A1V6R6A2_9EURO|nr:uncharacterized protein PENSOL_c014G12065 [Penicillium solitum]KAJ5680807.1 hypothetical protein N7536_011946 [Penicillium majusculum]OQD96863.1 hypothetical protein PENSOL_c014G12065 [Penicillium solitum]